MQNLRNGLKGKAGEINSVKVYHNLDSQKLQILADNKGKAGVYRFTNLTNGKSYVGSSVNLSRRFYLYYNISHLLKQKSSLICRALLKYGYSNFKLEIFEYCEPTASIQREQHYLDLLEPSYNVLKTAGSSLGHKHCLETKAKISQALLGKNNPNFGRKISEETRDKMAEAKLGRKLSEETRAKMSASSARGISVKILDLDTNQVTEFDSVRKAADSINSHKNTILRREKSQLEKGINTPYRNRYMIEIKRD